MTVFSKPTGSKPSNNNNNNPRHRAPIPLYPEANQTTDDNSQHGEIKLKLRRNPAQANSAQYEKYYTPFDGTTAEEYCDFRTTFEEIVTNVPLNTAPQKFAQITGLLTGTSKTYWETCVDNLDPADVGTDNGFDLAMEEFALNYCTINARQEQKRLMNRYLGKPKDMTVNEFWNRIKKMNRNLPYLSGIGTEFPDDQVRDILVTGMPKWMEGVMLQADYRWEDPTKTDRQVVQYLERLNLIGGAATGDNKAKKKNDKVPHKAGRDNGNGKKPRLVCDYCTKKMGKTWYGHLEKDCRRKQKDKKANGDTAEQHTMHATAAEDREYIKSILGEEVFNEEMDVEQK